MAAAIFASYYFTQIAIALAVLGATVVLLVLGGALHTPRAASILGGSRLAAMEGTWGVFSRGRNAMNQIRFGLGAPPPTPFPASGPPASWYQGLGTLLAEVLINPYAEDEEVARLNLRLNDVIGGARMADVIDASVRCRGSRGGNYGDLLRDFAAVCQLMLNGEF